MIFGKGDNKQKDRSMRFRGIAGTFLPILLFFVVFSPWGMGDEEGMESGEKRTLPTPEEEARLKSDPFFQSFANAFDDVMREECPDWKKSPAPEGESDREARSTNDSLPPQISEVERDRLFVFFQTERKRLDSALIDALIYQNAIGHKARRSFRFLRNSVGEFRRVDQVGDFDMTRGEFLRTGSPNDVAIEGEGFFQVVLRDSRRDEGTDSTPSRFYTRAGNFQKDEKGAFFLPAPETGNADQEETTPLRYYLDPPVDSIGDIPIFRFMSPERLTSADGIFFSRPK